MFWRRQKTRAEKSAIVSSALEQIKRAWSVDESDVTPHKDGFDWLPGSHTVRVRMHEGERKADEPVRYRITITTDFLRSVPAGDPKVMERTADIAHAFCPTFSLAYLPSELRKADDIGQPTDMQFFGSAYIDEITAPWLTGLLARMSILQPIFAELLSDMQENPGGGIPAFANGVKNETPHDVLKVDHLIRADGATPSNWTGSDEFEEFAEAYAGNDLCFGFGDDNGLTLETPFGEGSAPILFKTDEPYPPLGNGLVVETRIRSHHRYEEICRNAALLNHLESVQWTDFPQLGRWHPCAPSDEYWALAHSCFVPNQFFAEGLVENYGIWAIARAQWARSILLPDAETLTMREILEARLRK